MPHYKISDHLYLVQQTVSKDAPKAAEVEQPTNHIAVIDCSGSMSWDLPKIREQLKSRLPKLLKEQDTMSLVWFSGRREFGVLLEAEPVATLKDLQSVNQAIDRWLKPVGLTGFKEPLEEIPNLVDRIAKKRPGTLFSMMFMSDGCDNQWNRQDVVKAAESAGQKLSSVTFVEYGYYADRPLLTAMAEKAGGTLIFAQDFDQYVPNFEAVLQRKVSGAPKIAVKIEGDPISGFAYALQGGDLYTFAIEGGSVSVPADLKEVWYVSPNAVGTSLGDVASGAKDHVTPNQDSTATKALPAVYAALSLYAQRMKSDVVYALLRSVGDVRFIEQFSGCFGKQKYSEFMEAAKAASFDAKLMLQQGFDPNKVPKDDAFTVLDLLQVLASDDDNRVLLDSKDFKYSKIGRGRIDSSEILTPEEEQQIQALTEELGKTKDAKKVKELTAKIAAVTANKPEALKFEGDKQEDGYSVSNLTYNEERPNISFLVRRTGTVDLSKRLPENLKAIPATFSTFIFRNYTVVKDGLVNLERLPVRLTAGTIRKLKEQGMPIETILGVDGETDAQARVRAAKASDGRPVSVVFDIKSLPVINRKMVKEVSAQTYFEQAYEITKVKALQKVYNAYKKEWAPKESKGFVEQYGKEAADWLKEQGITDYSGFSPKSVQAPATDFYMGKELTSSLKGLSSLPTFKEAQTKIAKGGALTPSLALMAPAFTEVQQFLDTKPSDAEKAKWIETKAKETTARTRELMGEMARLTFTTIVGQVWFKEFKSLDENTLTITVDGQKVDGKVEMKDVEIKI